MHPRSRNLLLTSTALLALGTALGLLLAAPPVAAGPAGGTVVGGSATISGQGSSSVIVNQSSNSAIINWNTFNIGAGESVRFNQPNSSSIALNRVTGGLGPSEILGTLTANGRVFVINRDGVLFGAGAVINTAGFLATTSDIRNSDFMAGRMNFSIPGRPDASIVNLGRITATSGGFAALVAPGVRNSGTITANLGTVTLAAGNKFTLDMYGDRLITLAVNDQIASKVIDVATGKPLTSLVTNDGRIRANGGRVELTAAAARTVVDSVINTSGVIQANSIGRRNGMIVLSAATGSSKGAGAPTQTIRISGTVSAAGKRKGTSGGTVVVSGEDIRIANARIDASGRNGGGRVMIGGDWAGGRPNMSALNNPSARLENYLIPTATTVTVDSNTTINASAIDRGNGGKVILWSEQLTTFAGTILARGGMQSGDGGFVEVSGHDRLAFTGNVDTRAPQGNAGTLLLDPRDILIQGPGPDTITQSGTNFTSNVDTSILTTATLANALSMGNVIVQTGSSGSQQGNITVASSFSYGGSNSLTLLAHQNIHFDENVVIANTGGANVTLRADSQGTGVGTVSFDTGAGISTSGNVSIYFNPSVNPAGSLVNSTSYVSPAENFTSNVMGGGTLRAYMLVNTGNDLQNMQNNLTGSYALGRDITANPLFTPIGNVGTPFLGVLDGRNPLNGQRYAIDQLTINSGGGLFGVIGKTGEVSNLNLTNVSNANPYYTATIGAVAAFNIGSIDSVSASGVINMGSYFGVTAGGLVGLNSGTITNSHANVQVTVGDGGLSSNFNYAGGLAGINTGTISNSSAEGAVTSGNSSFAGGLVGQNGNTGMPGGLVAVIQNSWASGAVTSDYTAGGLVGANFISTGGSATITGSHASGNVVLSTAGAFAAGGLVGQNEGTIQLSYYTTGTVSGSGAMNLTMTGLDMASIGGLVGINGTSSFGSSATITDSRVISATVTGGNFTNAGGLVGNNGFNGGGGSIIFSNSFVGPATTGSVSGGNSSLVGGLVGRNDSPLTNATSAMAVSGVSGHVSGTPTNLEFGSGIGGLVGQNFATITNSSASGPVNAQGDIANPQIAAIAGGLVGLNNNPGQIINSHATGNVSGTGQVELGGLVGANASIITGSYATGAVSTTGPASGNVGQLGGLVGMNSGSISNSNASGPVDGTGTVRVGGLAGDNESSGSITNSFATGAVTATTTGAVDISAGGLVGDNDGQITASHASGPVTTHNGDAAAGGLVGSSGFGTNISNSFATGNVTINGATNGFGGGLVGGNAGDISNSFATGNVNVNAAVAVAGGLMGANIGDVDHAYATGSVNVSGTAGVAGGFVGVNIGFLDQTFSTGAVGGTATFNALGGHTGANTNLGTIQNAYATGAVTGSGNSVIGGFAAVNVGSLDQTYAIGKLTGGSITGGLVGTNNSGPLPLSLTGHPDIGPTLTGTGTATNSYWDPQTTGASTSAGGATRTTQDFLAALPQGFSTSVWGIQPDPSYPHFAWQPPNTVPTTTLNDQPPLDVQPAPQQQIINNLVGNVQLAALNTAPVVDVQNNGILLPKFPPPVPPGGQPPPRPGAGAANPFLPPGFDRRIVDIPLASETRYLKDQVIVQIRDDIDPIRLRDALSRLGLTTLATQKLGTTGSIALQLRISGGQSVAAIIRELAKYQVAAAIQPNYVFVAGPAPASAGDPAPASRGDVTQQGDAAQYILKKLQISDVHRVVRGTNVPIAVIDSLIDAEHPDLQGVIAQSFSTITTPEKPHSHGTGMAGAIASHQRLMGIAPAARLYAVHAFSTNAANAESTTFNILKGVDWATAQNVRIINMSFAGPKDPSLERTLKAAYNKGIVLIAAAGNAGPKSPPLYPGADPSVIAVTATDVDDKIFTGANRGSYVSVAAPGVDILVPAPDGAYQLTTGTSVAAAEVSGIVALLLERNPKLTPADIKRILTGSAKRLAPGDRTDDFGSGLVDPLRALQSADPRTVTTTPPTVRQR